MTLAEVHLEQRAEGTVVHVRGEIDLSNADTLRQQVIGAVPHDGNGVVVDLSETTYLDSSGIRLLFDLAERLQARRQRLALVVTEDAMVRRVLVLTKLDEAVPLTGGIDDAFRALNRL
jgi:anti-sigma B factor antagonist/stage II sporulation protein AA (anti-sigma F factor antagonist)